MKAMPQHLKLYICFALFLTHCTTVSEYTIDRGYDLLHTVTVGVEQRVYGFNLMVGPLAFGLQAAEEGIGVGSRAGSQGAYSTGETGAFFEPDGDSYLLANSVYHRSAGMNHRDVRGKDFSYRNTMVFVATAHEGYMSFFQCEFSLGLHYGLRLGFNLAEIFDLAAGLIGVDPLADDMN